MDPRKIKIYVHKENIYKGKIAIFRNITNDHGCTGCTFYRRNFDRCSHAATPCEDYKRSDNKNVKFVKIK